MRHGLMDLVDDANAMPANQQKTVQINLQLLLALSKDAQNRIRI